MNNNNHVTECVLQMDSFPLSSPSKMLSSEGSTQGGLKDVTGVTGSLQDMFEIGDVSFLDRSDEESYEEVMFGAEGLVLDIPSGLCENEEICDDFFTVQLWRQLPLDRQAELKVLTPLRVSVQINLVYFVPGSASIRG